MFLRPTLMIWSIANHRKFMNDAKPAIQLLRGTEAESIKPADHFIHLPYGTHANSSDLKDLLSGFKVQNVIRDSCYSSQSKSCKSLENYQFGLHPSTLSRY
jgi:hypothetical protein